MRHVAAGAPPHMYLIAAYPDWGTLRPTPRGSSVATPVSFAALRLQRLESGIVRFDYEVLRQAWQEHGYLLAEP